MPLKIFLIGLPGSGKSTLGKQLAHALKLPFVDLDDAIENHCNLSISEIFKSKGEDWFREMEAHILRSVAEETESFVMATGGGSPCFYEGIDFMNRVGTTIFLDVSLTTIAQRLSQLEKSARPLFNKVSNLGEALQQLQQGRVSYYRKAKLILKEDEIEANQILEKLSFKK
mgnify:CR=1 FL=1